MKNTTAFLPCFLLFLTLCSSLGAQVAVALRPGPFSQFRKAPAKRYETRFVSVEYFEETGLSSLIWPAGADCYRILSNMDFRKLRPMDAWVFEDEGTVYSIVYLASLGNWERFSAFFAFGGLEALPGGILRRFRAIRDRPLRALRGLRSRP